MEAIKMLFVIKFLNPSHRNKLERVAKEIIKRLFTERAEGRIAHESFK
jgi:hypothetical protein